MGGMHSNLVCANSFNQGWMRRDGRGNQNGTKTLSFTSKVFEAWFLFQLVSLVFTTFISHPLPLRWCACLSNLCVFEKGTELITASLKSVETAAQKTVCLAPKQADAVRTRRCCVAMAVYWSTHKGRSVNVWSLESLIWCQLKHYSRCSVNSSVNNWTIIIYWLQYLPATEKTL